MSDLCTYAHEHAADLLGLAALGLLVACILVALLVLVCRSQALALERAWAHRCRLEAAHARLRSEHERLRREHQELLSRIPSPFSRN